MVRVKHRYLLVQATPSSIGDVRYIDKTEIVSLMQAGVKHLYGIYGAGCCLQMSVIYNNILKTGIVIVKCRFECALMVKETLKRFGTPSMPFPYSMRVIHISGTIRSCKREAIKHDAQTLI